VDGAGGLACGARGGAAVLESDGGQSPPASGRYGAWCRTADSLSLEVEFRGDTLLARWSRLPEATSYDARFYTGNGAVLFERELAETTLVLPPGVLKVGTAVLMQVQAWDDLRQLRGRSGLRPVSRPPGN
jgi:hypothetical protein